MRNIVLAAGAAAALTLAPQLASAAPMLGGAALKVAAESATPVENVTYYGYYGRRYYGGGYGYYRPRYYGYYNYYRPYGGYGYYRPYRYRYYY